MTQQNESNTYVYGDTEVKLTGRTSYLRRGNKTDILHEITPVDSTVGSWKKWVSMTTLYTIVQQSAT